jgi:hemerythrin-like domain-containing protein
VIKPAVPQGGAAAEELAGEETWFGFAGSDDERVFYYHLPRHFYERYRTMSKTYHSSNRWALTGLFKRINLGDDPRTLCSEASHLVEKVDSNDIAAAQKALIDEGYSQELVEKISAAFVLMGLPKKKTAKSKLKLADNHIVQKIAAEHTVARCWLEDLREITEEIVQMDSLTNVSSEFRRLSRIVDYFDQFKRHIEREEDIVFPYLNQYGWNGLCKTEIEEHKLILKDIDNLYALLMSLNMMKSETFRKVLQKIADHFIPLLNGHMNYEEDLLWPIALTVVDEPEVWQRIKAVCDEFEY